jgi:hypothetical protein
MQRCNERCKYDPHTRKKAAKRNCPGRSQDLDSLDKDFKLAILKK